MAGELIIPVNCMECTLSWSMSGKSNPITSTIGVRAGTATDFASILDELCEGLTNTGSYCSAGYMNIGWTFEGATGIANVAGVLEGFSSSGAPVAGTVGGGNGMIVSSAFLLQKRTARIGRHFRGRMYLPVVGIQEGSVNTMGVIADSVYGDARTAIGIATAFWLASTTWQPVLLHTDTVVTPGYTPITAFSPQQKLATQRRRLRS